MKPEYGKIWIVGACGRVGSEITKLLDMREIELLKTDLDDVDITNAQDVSTFADMNRPDAIINCAGMTDVEECENNIEKAFKVNAIGARNLSTAARKIRARLVQMSTDDVFDGTASKPYNEFDYTYPSTVYGKSKLAGENFVKELSPKHMIVRSSWVYGEKNNFVTSILELAEKKMPIFVTGNQFASPTSAKELAKTVIRILQDGDDGIYHAVCTGYCSRYEFAEEILKLSGKSDAKLTLTKEDSLPVAALRPSYSVLDNLMLRICGIETPPDWKQALKEFMIENHYYTR